MVSVNEVFTVPIFGSYQQTTSHYTRSYAVRSLLLTHWCQQPANPVVFFSAHVLNMWSSPRKTPHACGAGWQQRCLFNAPSVTPASDEMVATHAQQRPTLWLRRARPPALYHAFVQACRLVPQSVLLAAFPRSRRRACHTIKRETLRRAAEQEDHCALVKSLGRAWPLPPEARAWWEDLAS